MLLKPGKLGIGVFLAIVGVVVLLVGFQQVSVDCSSNTQPTNGQVYIGAQICSSVLGYSLEAVGGIAIAGGIALLAAALIDSKKP